MMQKVLVVDDSLTVRMDLKQALENVGFEVVLCESISQAKAALVQHTVALVVLDVILPDGDGVAFLSDIKSDPTTAHLPIMLLSTEAEVRDRIRGLKTGADEYVGKPYDTSYVISRARELVPNITAPQRQTLLVIDDSVTFREQLRTAFETEGYAVITAETGEEGLRLAASTRPACILVDGVLPGIDGATVVRRLRLDSALRRTPCLLLTASEEADYQLRALDSGADGFVQKEVGVDVIRARVSALMRQTPGLLSNAVVSASSFGPKKILAVDDSLTYLHELALHLRKEGYDVVLAHSGEEALDLLAVEQVDCILLDLLMPGLSGRDTCQRIKSSPVTRDIPLIMLTALEEQAAMIEGMNAGADDYIAKASDFDVVKARLRAQLRRKQIENENRQIREQLLAKELEAAQVTAARELADTRAELLANLEMKNDELELAKGRAERESQFKSRFLANMSHELRTPLNAIIGFSELLTDVAFGPLSTKQKDFIENIVASGRHLLALINDVLDLSKVEAGKMDLHREWISLDTIMDGTFQVVEPLARKQGVHIDVSIPKELQNLYVDPMRIKQVLYNLLSNGIKFTPAGGKVRLSVQAQGPLMELAVEDTGVGISERDLARLFQEFEQVGEQTSIKPEGTGLGLALTKKLVELHGGVISVSSELGKGSKFLVQLPIQHSELP
jgi:DNA-binding response OmpR family regulator